MSASSAAAAPQPKWWSGLYPGLQKMGRSLQLPIAVLPAAGLLNGLGQPGVLGEEGLNWTIVSKVMVAAGGALLNADIGLPLLFCIGVAIGMAKKADGSTALAAVAGFLVYRGVLHAFPNDCPIGTKAIGGGCIGPNNTFVEFTYQNPGVFGGIVMGLLAAWFWQRFHRVKLVDWLGFFNGHAAGADHHVVRGDRVRRALPVGLAAGRQRAGEFLRLAGGAGLLGSPASSAWPTARCW